MMFCRAYKGLLVLVLVTGSLHTGEAAHVNDLIHECGEKYDYNKNGKIDEGGEEYVCRKALNNVELEEELAKGREELKKLAKILALLSPQDLEKEINRYSKEIENENDLKKKKRMEEKLTIFKEARIKKAD